MSMGQETSYRRLRELNKTGRVKIQLNRICKDEENRYFVDLWTIKQEEELIVNAGTDGNVDIITVEEVI
jgi:hypothetical protein